MSDVAAGGGFGYNYLVTKARQLFVSYIDPLSCELPAFVTENRKRKATGLCL
jgi:hypothetical protein